MISMDDLIYRKDAIDAVGELVSSMSVCISVDECHGMKRMQGNAVRTLNNLPSAEPLADEDYIELRDRFGEFVEFVVRDMISGKGERWKKKM